MNTSLKPVSGLQPACKGNPFPGILLALVLLFTSLAVFAHGDDVAHGESSRVLGDINFPTSATIPEAQAAFIRGMLLLHLFEYQFAREEFIHAQQIEPDFAMAYWGEAMTHNHPIWDEQDLEAGRTALQKLAATGPQRLALTDAPKEKGLLAALDHLYGEGSKAGRDQAYARAMEWLAASFPEDHEVQLFYALSLFGVQAGVRDVPTYMMSTAIAQSVFSVNPQHPGAAHYLIHGVDDPDHAVLGLAAARALAVMAPDAGHSQHMTSHIFVALGMWDDVVKANEAAVEVQNQMRVEQGLLPRHYGHYNFWLMYGYLQQGRIEQAQTLLRAAFQELQAKPTAPKDRMILNPDRSILGSVVQMWARYLIESRDWHGDIAEWKFNMGDAFDPNLNFAFVQSMRAAYGSQAARAAQYLEQFRSLKTELEQVIRSQDDSAPTDLLYLERLAVLEQEMLAGIEIARGEYLAAANYASEANRLEGEMPFAFGPPFVDWPAAELLGETLFNGHKYVDAANAYEVQLKRTRLRSSSLLGLAGSQLKAGRDADARYAVEQLRIIWREADSALKTNLDSLAEAAQPDGTR